MNQIVDAHAHLDAEFGGGWADLPARDLLDVMDAAGVGLLVDLSGGWGTDVLQRHLAVKDQAPDRFVMLGGIDLDAWPDLGPGFGTAAAASLRSQLAAGAGGLKVWKLLGLTARDEHGLLVPVDDGRLDPVWDVCADQDRPVVIHVGDPEPFFAPRGSSNPRDRELAAHPEWHWFERSEVARDHLLDQFERLLERRRDVRFVGAHVLDLLDQPRRLRALLHDHPNLSVDLGARFEELAAAPLDTTAVLAEHADRFLFGLDHPAEVAAYERALAVTREAIGRGLATLDERERLPLVVDSVLSGNARRLFRP